MAKKARPEEPKKGAPEYMSTYGDFITLMLCFFVLMFSMSSIDVAKYQQLAASLSGNPMSILDMAGSQGILDNLGSGIMPVPNATANNQPDTPKEEQLAQEELKDMASDFQTYAAQNNLSNTMNITVKDQYLLLTFADGLFFDTGKADLKPGAIAVLEQIAVQLRSYPECDVEIEGFTDNVPIKTAQFPNNFYLSSARAIGVASFLIDEQQLDSTRVSARGYGENNPVASNDTPEGRAKNRRVEIKIYSSTYSKAQ